MQRTLDSAWKSAFFKGCCLLMASGSPAIYAQQGSSSQQNSSQPSYQNQGSSQGQRPSDNQSRDQSGQQSYQSSQQSGSQSNSQFGETRNQFDANRNTNQGPANQYQSQNQIQRRQDQPAGLGVSISESNQQGVTVEQVHRGSPAEQAGIREGDQIVRISGRQIRSVPDLLGTIQNMDPGQRVQVEVLRDGREQTLTATLETRREALMPQEQFPGWSPQNFPQTPWGADQIAEHIQSLEQEIRYLTQEVQSLRSMISSDPDQFRSSEQSGSLQNQRMSQRSSSERAFDGVDRQEGRFNNSQNFPNQGSNQPLDSRPYSQQGNP